MSSARPLSFAPRRLFWLLPVAAAAAAAAVVHAALRLPSPAPYKGVAPPEPYAASAAAADIDWSRFIAPPAAAAPRADSLRDRFRLAGTFFSEGEAGQPVSRKAVIDDLAERQQVIVGEQDSMDGVTVVSISANAVRLRSGSEEVELRLSFAGLAAELRSEVASDSRTGAGAAAGTESRFGRQVGEHQWVFSRDALLAYYAELREDPARLVSVFDSLEPLYGDNRAIEGYRLNVAGEGDFFRAAGLSQGDVVRRVNSMRMTNRRRAEYFIREFVAERVSAFVIDIERNGDPLRLIYNVR